VFFVLNGVARTTFDHDVGPCFDSHFARLSTAAETMMPILHERAELEAVRSHTVAMPGTSP